MNDLQEEREEIIDIALNNYPLAPLPPNFVAQVMARVAHLPQWRPEPFRLHWRDGVLPALTAVATYLLLTLGLWLVGQDVAWLPEAPTLFAIQWDSLITVSWLSISIMIVAGEIGLLCLVGMGLWWDRPFVLSQDL